MLENLPIPGQFWALKINNPKYCECSPFFLKSIKIFKKKGSLETKDKTNNIILVALESLTHLLRHTNCKIQNFHQWVPKWPTDSGKGSTLRSFFGE